MEAKGAASSWGIALIGGCVLGYAFGFLTVPLGLDPDKNSTPILILFFPGMLLGIVATTRRQAATSDVTGKPPLVPAMLATAVGAMAAIFTEFDIGNLGPMTLMVWIVIALVPIGVGFPVGIMVRFLYRTIRKKESSNDGSEPK